MTETPGVQSYVPADAMARNAAAFGATPYRSRINPSPPPFTGRPTPMPDDTAPLAPPLDQLADAEAPEVPPEPATLAQLVADHAARLAALEAMARPLTPEEWTG